MSNQSLSSVACYNALVGRLNLSKNHTISIAISFALEIPVIVACNGVLITALYKTKQIKSAANCVVMLLCISDLFIGLLSVPLLVILFAAFSHTRNCWLEMSTIFVGQFNSHFSGYMTMIMAIQRYLNANPSFLLRRRSSIMEMMTSEAGCKMLTCIAFIVSIAHGVVTTYLFNSTRSNIPNVVMVAINFIAVTTVYIIYGKLVCRIKIHVANTVSHHESRPRFDSNIGCTPEMTRRIRSHTQTSFVVSPDKIEMMQDNACADKDETNIGHRSIPSVISKDGFIADETGHIRCNMQPVSFDMNQDSFEARQVDTETRQDNACADKDDTNTTHTSIPSVISKDGFIADETGHIRCNTQPVSFDMNQDGFEARQLHTETKQDNACSDKGNINTRHKTIISDKTERIRCDGQRINFDMNQENFEACYGDTEKRQKNITANQRNSIARPTTTTSITLAGPCVVSNDGLKTGTTKHARCDTLQIISDTGQEATETRQENKRAYKDNIDTRPRASSSTNLITSKRKTTPPQTRYYYDFTKTIALILLSLAICTFPFLITDLWTGYYSFVKRTKAPQTVRYLYYLSFAPGFMHCTINALLLLYRNQAAAKYVKNALRLPKKKVQCREMASTTGP